MSRVRAGVAALAAALALVAGLSLGSCRAAQGVASVPTLRLRLAKDPATFDPAHAADQHSVAVVAQIFDGLVQFDPSDLSVKPALADRWEVSDNGLRYTFHLRSDARFHNGRQVTAEDVAWSFDRLLAPATRSERRWVLGALADTRVVDPATIELALVSPSPFFLTNLCLEAASVVPREIYDDPAAGYLRHPIGAGPFAFESWLPGERISLVRAASDPSGDPRLVRRVVYRIITSEATALQEYLAGGLDILDEVPSGRRNELAYRLGGQYRRTPQPAIAYLGFNHRGAPFAGNRALRQAFNYAVDKRYICDVINEGKDTPANGLIPHGVPGYDPDLEGYPFDPDRARALLARAGYPGGRGLPEITVYYNTSGTQQRIMERVQIDLARIGVEMRLKNLDPPALMQALAAGEPAFFRMAWLAESPDPESFLTPTLHSSSGPAEGNFSRYANPEFDRLIERARGAGDPVERLGLYREAQRIAVEDACWVFLYFYRDEALVKPRVTGLTIPALGDFLAPLAGVSLEPDGTAAGF